ncbi:hypothetical protein ACIBEA_29710 [Streptomyces sp. NPDC051555]|uniref:hypothetical protein n=1 Tax=Streptomyces sp. NPDC051555 TaxID=3365657 RepID=UPI003797D2CE
MAVVIGEVKPGFLADNKANATMIPLPPQNGGTLRWGRVYVSFATDFGDATLRVAIWGNSIWRVSELKVTSTGGRAAIYIQDGDEKVSVGRVKAGATDTGDCPVAYLLETTLQP